MSSQITQLAQKIIESPAFRGRFNDIQVKTTKHRLSFNGRDIEEEVVKRLILQASVLALSEDVQHRGYAQKINALLHEAIPENDLVSYAIQVILSRLGNFPAVSAESDIFSSNHLFRTLEENDELTKTLDPEIVSNLYSEEEASKLEIRDLIRHFNVFQKEILDALEQKALVSFSAPTSFGKSFIVRHHLVRGLVNGTINRALIIVPTKSLIDDFFEGILRLKRELGLDVALYSHARSVDAAPERSIFILTQERLSFLIEKNPDFLRSFQVVYCDEAHYISRGYRGFVLRNVLRKVVELCGIRTNGGSTQYIFSSPIIENPEYYKNLLFPQLDDAEVFHKKMIYSPVEKNVHFVIKGNRDYKYYLFRESLSDEDFSDRLEEVGSYTFPDDLHKNDNENITEGEQIKRNVRIVLDSPLKERTILFATNPRKAHEYAQLLAQQLGEKNIITAQEMRDIRKYITDHYDNAFGIAELIVKGVGLHYGGMPLGLRRMMVRLFEQGKIDYIICTSTLLEGVNLPAKNIFLFSNKQGGGKHTPLSFWNLIGRAGRATYGLSGNIFCLEDKPEVYKDLFDKKEAEIKDPEDEVAENTTKRNYVINSFLDDEKRFEYATKSQNRGDIEYLIYELLTGGNIEHLIARLTRNEEIRATLLTNVYEQRDSLMIPIDLIRKNPGIDPRLQDSLFQHLQSLTDIQLQTFLEVSSNPLGARANQLEPVLRLTFEMFKWPKEAPRNRDGTLKYDSVQVTANRITQWLHESTIGQFIQQSLNYFRRENPNASSLEKIERALRVIDTLDKELSYHTPKYLKCFFDITVLHARAKGVQNITQHEERIEGFLFSIESGISSLIGRYLFEKGVARPIAVQASRVLQDIAPRTISPRFFVRADVLERLESGLSRLAFEELTEHLNE